MAKKDNKIADEDFDTFENSDGDSLLVDLRGVEEQNFDPVPNGKYAVVVDECEYRISQSSGNPMWSMRFEIFEGEYANRKLFMFVSFSEKALPMAKRYIGRLKPELLDGPFDPKEVAESGELIGVRVFAKVKIEKGQDDEPRNTVKDLLEYSEGGDDFDV